MESRSLPRLFEDRCDCSSLDFQGYPRVCGVSEVQTSLHGRHVNVDRNVTALGAIVVLLSTKQTSTRSGRSRGSLCTLKTFTPSGHVAGGAAAGHAATVIANGAPESMLNAPPSATSSMS